MITYQSRENTLEEARQQRKAGELAYSAYLFSTVAHDSAMFVTDRQEKRDEDLAIALTDHNNALVGMAFTLYLAGQTEFAIKLARAARSILKRLSTNTTDQLKTKKFINGLLDDLKKQRDLYRWGERFVLIDNATHKQTQRSIEMMDQLYGLIDRSKKYCQDLENNMVWDIRMQGAMYLEFGR